MNDSNILALFVFSLCLGFAGNSFAATTGSDWVERETPKEISLQHDLNLQEQEISEGVDFNQPEVAMKRDLSATAREQKKKSESLREK